MEETKEKKLVICCCGQITEDTREKNTHTRMPCYLCKCPCKDSTSIVP